MPHKSLGKKINAALIIAFCAITFFGIAAYFNIFELWQLKLSDFLYQDRAISENIVIVGVDDFTLSNEGLGHFENWDRSVFAQALNNINKYSPKAVAFDFFFKSPRTLKEDLMLHDEFEKTANSVVIFNDDPIGFDDELNSFFASSIKPLDLIVPKNTVVSMVNSIPDVDNVMRGIIPAIWDINEKIYHENLGISLARIFFNLDKSASDARISTTNYSFGDKSKREITIPLEKGQILVNYALKPGEKSYKYVSFFDVFRNDFAAHGNSPEKIFSDKIVIVGPTADYFKDNVTIPKSSRYMIPGVEIHASVLQMIMEGNFLRYAKINEKIIAIVLFGLLAAYFFMFKKIRWAVLFLAAGSLGYSALAPWFFSRGVIIDLVHPYLVLIVMFVTIFIYRYFTEFKERMALKSAFSKYVSASVVEQIANSPESVKLGGEKREISIIFTDIAGFTSISEKLAPESLVAFLNEYLDAMTRIILDEGGTLDKFEGDAIMAFFGAPLTQADHAVRACNVALKMREAMSFLNDKWKNDEPLPNGEKKPQIDFRCGINTGEAIVGNVGSDLRFDYTALGDCVNLSSRLEGANKKYSTRIMMSETTFNMVKNEFVARELDLIIVVGKRAPVRVFELLGPMDSLNQSATILLNLYNEGLRLYHSRDFTAAQNKFEDILKSFPLDGPSKVYRQRCEILKDFPPAKDWDGVYEMATK
jgi:adenylate cyclase